MVEVTVSRIIDVPVSTLWPLLRDFGGVARWHPAITRCAVEDIGGEPSIGSIRMMEMKGLEGSIREQLLELSDTDHRLSYAMLASPLPVANYRGEVRLAEAAQDGGTCIAWKARFDCAEANEADLQANLTGFLKSGLDALAVAVGVD